MLIRVMIMPMLLKIDFGALGEVRQHVRGIGVALGINRAVRPSSVAPLVRIFVRQVFSPHRPADPLDSRVAGLILPPAARRTAMEAAWSWRTRRRSG